MQCSGARPCFGFAGQVVEYIPEIHVGAGVQMMARSGPCAKLAISG